MASAVPLLAALWNTGHGNSPLRQVLAGALCGLWLLSCVWMQRQLRQWQRLGSGQLTWRQGHWSWLPADREALPVRLHIAWDGQHHLLLRCHPGSEAAAAGIPPWLWLECSTAPALWGDLRRALAFNPGQRNAE